MSRVWLCVLSLFAVLAGMAATDRVDSLVRTEMDNRHIPGVALAVVRDGRVVKRGAYGLANVELQAPVTPRTVFQIQSITKTFVSAGVLMLAQAGDLAIDDPIGQHLADVPAAWTGITIRHLLAHTSGLKDYVNDPVADLRRDATEDDVFKATVGRPLNFAPGEKYAYSNVNYLLLAMIIRARTGHSYGEFLQTRIFDPLGMRETRIMSHSDVVSNRADGYLWQRRGLRNGDFISGQVLGQAWGGLLSTAEDMAKWAAAVDGGALLPKALWQQAWTPPTLGDGRTSSYGLGWAIEPVNGRRGVGHGGGHVTGFSSHLIIYPDDHLAVVILSNSSNSRVASMARKIAGMFVPALAVKTEPAIPDADPAVPAILRDCLARAASGGLAETQFTPELWKIVEPARAILEERLSDLGAVRTLELLSQKTNGGKRVFRYRAIAARGTIVVTLGLEGTRVAELRMADE